MFGRMGSTEDDDINLTMVTTEEMLLERPLCSRIFHACEGPKLWVDINSKSNKLFNKTCIWKHNSTNTTFMRSSNTTWIWEQVF
ncbi:nuclear pore complex protein NUP98A-like [Iris pallida]|uniref:Nuclear pore complex protein NUP98A-like n=1 Tax=Iris pallida TaxID=29817 RepID=A0AAX6FFN7_IRIPA|nr:nuclear pore complex protein NUP98A-like [Iris pallida]KAJ6823503.1 nuclear pore complex protein NUP98A-like [Iris pallida]